MATYKCLADLQGKTLKYDDIVILKNIEYRVQSRFLQEPYCNNEAIFNVLSISSKEDFASNAYGYECSGGSWPECKPYDYAALTKCVIELYKIIERKTSSLTSKKEQWYKITTPGKTNISPEQVKELIIKYGGIINPDYNYKSEIGIYYWKKDEIVDVATKLYMDATEVFPITTTEITTIKQEEKYETQFQRKKARIERGTRPEGSTVCGRRGKASIAVGHLGYRKVTGI